MIWTSEIVMKIASGIFFMVPGLLWEKTQSVGQFSGHMHCWHRPPDLCQHGVGSAVLLPSSLTASCSRLLSHGSIVGGGCACWCQEGPLTFCSLPPPLFVLTLPWNYRIGTSPPWRIEEIDTNLKG